jgi:hypothetical protein
VYCYTHKGTARFTTEEYQMNSVKWTTVRNNENAIVEYHTTVKNVSIKIEKVDAIGIGTCYTLNSLVFDTVKSAKNFVAKFGA